MKSYKKTIIITTLITLLPIIAGLILWNKLPDKVPTHWGSDGQVNGWSSKPFAVFGFPCILALIHLVATCVTVNDPRRKNIHKKPLMLVFWTVPVLSFVTSGLTYSAALGVDMNIAFIVSMLVGILFIALGNYMPKLQQNYTVGIKLPWTLNSAENWNRTHRLGGRLFIVGGFIMIASGSLSTFLGKSAATVSMLLILAVCALIPAGYSFWLYKKGI